MQKRKLPSILRNNRDKRSVPQNAARHADVRDFFTQLPGCDTDLSAYPGVSRLVDKRQGEFLPRRERGVKRILASGAEP
jgi:hypothetical protein